MSELSKQHRLGEIKEHPFGSDRGFRASHFLAGIHEQAIERVVSSAAEGMAFLQAGVQLLWHVKANTSASSRNGASQCISNT